MEITTKKYKKGDNILTIVGNAHIMSDKSWEQVEEEFKECDIILCEGILHDSKHFLKTLKEVKESREKMDEEKKEKEDRKYLIFKRFYKLVTDITNKKPQKLFYLKVIEDMRYICCDTTSDKIPDIIDKKIKLLEENIDQIEYKFKKYRIFYKLLFNVIIHFGTFISLIQEDDEDIIVGRNKVVLDVLPDLFETHKRIGILYGKGHLRDFDTKLIDLGYKESKKPQFFLMKIINTIKGER